METQVKQLAKSPKSGPESSPAFEGGAFGQGPDHAKAAQLQSAANASSQVSQLRSLQAAANASPQVQQFKRQQDGAANGPVQRKENNTGLPDNLKSGVEHLSGYAMDDVKVHYNSEKPEGLNAHAFAQGTDIHLAPGQEQHLPHEAWHVAQQKQGRVQATQQLKGVGVNSDAGLEKEADVMGAKAAQMKANDAATPLKEAAAAGPEVSQRKGKTDIKYGGLLNGCGTKMQAYIDHDEVQYGSSPQEQPNWWGNMSGLSNKISNFMSRYLVQGHLLNDNLGGPGTMENMTPITKSANTTMLNFYEREIKNAVLKNDCDVEYYVAPVYTSHPTADELAGNSLDSNEKTRLDNSGYLNLMAGQIYAHYTIIDGYGRRTDSNGLWIKNENRELRGGY